MDTNILRYDFNGQSVEFNFTQGNVMVNATQMAKLFDAQIAVFMRNVQTKAFIKACLNSENSHYLNAETEEDLYTSAPKTGTFMHRVLALKFAAWLDPDFELWVFSTIDEILFGNLRLVEKSLRESAVRKNKMDALLEELGDDPRFVELETLRLQERQASYGRGKHARQQLQHFRQTVMELE